MCKKIVFLFLTLFFCQNGFAQNHKTGKGQVVDYLTNFAIPDSTTKVELLLPDSTVIWIAETYQTKTNAKATTMFNLRIKKEGDYIIRCTNPDYETVYQPISIKFYKREEVIDLGKIQMKRILRKDIDEVVVTATKLKFYFNNDTLVYNADAFATQYGFVLVDILRKMPGITLEKGGEIYSNGRKVDALLLNGKDFFNNDRETLLENLPAYMIKKVLVYDKKKDSLSLYEREREFEGLVMDIKLKKEYHTTTLGSIDVGGGTNERYFGRLFGMNIHDLRRWSAYAGSNNTNQNEEMNHSGDFYNMDNGSGDKKFHFAGINYNVDSRNGDHSLQGRLRIQGSNEFFSQKRETQMFYNDGDVYDVAAQESDTRNFSFQTSHDINLFQNNNAYRINISPAFLYIHSKAKSWSSNTTANSNLANLLGSNWVDTLRAKKLSETLLLYGITRTNIDVMTPTDLVQLKLDLSKKVKIPHSEDVLTFNASGAYSSQTSNRYQHYAIDYIKLDSDNPQWKNLYHHNYNKTWQWTGEFSYLYKINKIHSITAKASYMHTYQDSNDSYYNLEQKDGWGVNTNYELGILPSQLELMDVLDKSNTQRYDKYDNVYSFSLGYKLRKKRHSLEISLPYNIQRKELRFFQENNNQTVKRTMNVSDLSIFYIRWLSGPTGFGYSLQANIKHNMPAMYNFVEQTNDASVLTIVKGNPHLKNATNYMLRGTFRWAPTAMNNHEINIFYAYVKNHISTAYLYNRETGVYTLTPTNVDGNQNFRVELSNAVYLTKDNKHKLSNKLSYNYIKSVDFSGTSLAEVAQKSTVHNSVISEELTYNFSSKNTKYRGSIAPNIDYHRSTSNREGFEPINAYVYGVKVSGQIELPWSVRMNTELRSVSRRGYAYDEMNDDEVIWNMGVTKSFKNNITLSLNVVDLLNQHKNVYRVVNAQGRMESVSNVLRSYAMLHFVWQFSKKNHP